MVYPLQKTKINFKSRHICLINPSISTLNLGDHFIANSCVEVLKEIFPEFQLINIPSQDCIGNFSRKILKNSYANIILGTNILTSNIFKYRQLRWGYIDLSRNYSLITMGVGWWQYQKNPDIITSLIYKRLLSSNSFHSTRDEYTKNMLKQIGFNKVLNTGCPTMWNIPRIQGGELSLKFKNSVLTFTDYSRDIQRDIQILIKAKTISENIFFFPQAPTDLSYLYEINKKVNCTNLFILNSSIESLLDVFKEGNSCYIGTRLHAGIYAAKNKIPCLILSIDNRVKEMFSDLGVPFLERSSNGFKEKLEVARPLYLNPNFNIKDIDLWKKKLRKYVDLKLK